MDASDRAVQGAAAARISARQVRELILTANRAWREQCRLGLTEDSFDTWRRGVLWDTVQQSSFRAMGQREFGLALGAFARLEGAAEASGGRGRAKAAAARREASGEGDRRRAEWCLRRECGRLDGVFGGEGRALAYAEGLLGRVHRTSLADATAKQVWQALFTLRSRAAAKRKKRDAAEGPQNGACRAAARGVPEQAEAAAAQIKGFPDGGKTVSE